MPDHIHFILWLITPTKRTYTRKRRWCIQIASICNLDSDIESHNIIEYPGHIWQNNYYERIIRKSELERTRLYIRNDPTRRKTPPKRTPPKCSAPLRVPGDGCQARGYHERGCQATGYQATGAR